MWMVTTSETIAESGKKPASTHLLREGLEEDYDLRQTLQIPGPQRSLFVLTCDHLNWRLEVSSIT